MNFGVFAGRNATQAEIDDLARLLHGEVESFAVIAEERHEFGDDRETSLRQIVIEVTGEYAGADPGDAVRAGSSRCAETWATTCIHDAHRARRARQRALADSGCGQRELRERASACAARA